MQPIRSWPHGTDTDAIGPLVDMRASSRIFRNLTNNASRLLSRRREQLTDWCNFVQNTGQVRLITAEKVYQHFSPRMSPSLSAELRAKKSQICAVFLDTANTRYIIVTFLECSSFFPVTEPVLTVSASAYDERFWNRVTLYTVLPGMIYGLLMDTAEYVASSNCQASDPVRTVKVLVDRLIRRYNARLSPVHS